VVFLGVAKGRENRPTAVRKSLSHFFEEKQTFRRIKNQSLHERIVERIGQPVEIPGIPLERTLRDPLDYRVAWHPEAGPTH
jgi:hypothetical protein